MSNYLDNLMIFDPTITKRGYSYYKEGRVDLKETSPQKVRAIVYGSSHYEVNLQFSADNDLINATCTCPFPGFCKHMVATLYATSDHFALHKEEGNEAESTDIVASLNNALDDISRSIYRYNYKGLSKAVEGYISVLLKAPESSRKKSLSDFLFLLFSKRHGSVDLDRLTPYVREVVKKSGLGKENLFEIIKNVLLSPLTNESFLATMLSDPEFSFLTQEVVLSAINEGYKLPFYLTSYAPVSSWPKVYPEFLQKALELIPYFATPDEMVLSMNRAKAHKEYDILFKLFGLTIEHFPGPDIPISIRNSLLEIDEYRESMEAFLFSALCKDFTPEKYLLWRSVVKDSAFQKRLGELISAHPKAKIDFILLIEGREMVGNLYDRIDVFSIPFPALNGKLGNVKEEKVIDALLEYAKRIEKKCMGKFTHNVDNLLSLLDVYLHFDRESLARLLQNEEFIMASLRIEQLRAKVLLCASKADMLPLLGVHEYWRD